MANQATENLFNAMDEIINARLQSLNYDTTIKAVIVNADQADKGIYTVSEIGAEQTNKFQAHSENTSYQRNDCVYVTIPRGDAAAENKIIIGKYIEDGDAYYNYVNPMDSFLDITGNLIQSLDASDWRLTANYEPISRIDIWNAQNLNLRGFDRLALKAQFKTWLESLDIMSGNYGLVLIIEDAKGEFSTFSLTTKEMYGNPYYYETYYAQEILLDIGAIEEIKAMYLTLFQANDFFTIDGKLAPSTEDGKENGPRISPNIFMKAPYISVGYDISNFDGDDLRIYTSDEQSYNCLEEPVEKTINAKWIHVAEGVSAVAVDHESEIPRNPDWRANQSSTDRYPQPETRADLTWYQWDKNASGTLITGKNWDQIEDALNSFTYTFQTDTSEEGTTIPAMRFKAMVEVPSLRYVNAQFALTDTYKDLVNSDNTSATYMECIDIFHDIMDNNCTQNDGRKQIAEKHTNNSEFDDDSYGNMITALNEYLTMRSEIKYIQSAELTFVNLGYAPEKYATDNIAELEVIVDPGGLKGQYLIYDDSGMITNPSEAEQTRYCEAVYKTLAGILHEASSNDDFKYEVDDTERICWYIPLDSTMIATPVEGVDYTAYDTVVKEYVVEDPNNDEGLPLGRYCKIERIPQRDKTEIDEDALIAEHHMYARQNFKIKDYYTQMETNNIIYCRITKRNKFYMGRGMMTFGVAGTNGTDSTFILKLFETGDENSSLSDIPASALSVNTHRYSEDKDGNIVTRFSPSTPGNGKLIIVPELYDYNNKLIENYFTDHDVTYKILTYEGYNQPFRLDRHAAGESKMVLSWSGCPAKGLDDENNDFYLVIEAEVPYKIVYEFKTYTQKDLDDNPALIDLGKQVGDYVLDKEGNKIPTGNTREDKLKTYLPISIVKDKLLKRTVKVEDSSVQVQPNDINPRDYFRQVIGANKVIYDRNGSNAKYYKDPYQLLNGLLEEVEGVTWYARIRASDGKTGPEKASIESFYPTVSPAGDESGQKLVPLEMFILGNSIAENFCVYGKKDGHVVCVQPVLIMQNKYGSSMLNKWDGGLTIDEKNGTILASMVGAGIKDENNTFSGVLMGDITQAFEDNHNGLGLYGFHQSDQSFGFNIDGTAFIGKAGHGRIWFDGNNGTISSGAYSDGVSPSFKYLGTGHNGEAPVIRPQQGMEIDLDGSDGISSSLKMFGPMGGLVVDTKERQMDDFWKSGKKIHIPTENDPDPRTITFKLFTGIYKNKEVPDTSKGEFKNTSLPYERGMIYFDNDGQYIQSTNYDGKYNITGTHTARLNALKPTGKNVEIKFGEYPAGLNGQTIPPGWNVWELNNKGKVEAEPVSYNDTPAQQGSFVDLQNGWIDMRNGIIGGWQISKDMIASRLGEIIMWSGNPKDNSEAGIPFIRIGAVRNKVMQGKLWIADYRVLGKTVAEPVGIYTIDNSGTADLSETGYDAIPAGMDDDSTSETVQKLTYLKTSLTSGSFSTEGLNSWGLQDDTDDNKSKTLGVFLETAIGAGDSAGKSIIVWRPQWTGSNVTASLGTTAKPWTNIYADNGIFLKESFTGYGGGSVSGWHLVATQDWVAKVIVAVLNERIKEVNNLAANALSTAKTALSKARKAISNILSWCAQWNGKLVISTLGFGFEAGAGMVVTATGLKITANTDSEGNLTGTISAETVADGAIFGIPADAINYGGYAMGSYLAAFELAVAKKFEDVYTKTEIDTLLAGYSKTDHNHDGTYSKTGHSHSGYASSKHNHDGVYSKVGHTHTA